MDRQFLLVLSLKYHTSGPSWYEYEKQQMYKTESTTLDIIVYQNYSSLEEMEKWLYECRYEMFYKVLDLRFVGLTGSPDNKYQVYIYQEI